MPLDTIVIADYGASNGSITFEDRQKSAGSSVWNASSPQGDLGGEPTLDLSDQVTRNNIKLTRAKLKVPVYDSTTGTYPRFREVDIVVKRHTSEPLASVSDDLDILAQACLYGTDLHTALVEGKPQLD
jgi:hypothetical protein